MKFYSPLRYPGGKNRLVNFIARICVKNQINNHYIEPYAGGAAVALYLLIEGYVSEITINDKNRSIYAFWYAILNHTEEFCNSVRESKVNISAWKKYKEVQKRKNNAQLLELGFSTFFLNRTNISGIIDSGPIGGLDQKGVYKIDCRLNKEKLINRIRKIAEFKNKIHLKNCDALELIEEIKADKSQASRILYFDPPYYLKGESLYLNHYGPKDHKQVARAVKSIKNAHWIVSYDNTLAVRKLYKFYKSKRYNLIHSAYKSKIGKEILFLSPKLLIPKSIFSIALDYSVSKP